MGQQCYTTHLIMEIQERLKYQSQKNNQKEKWGWIQIFVTERYEINRNTNIQWNQSMCNIIPVTEINPYVQLYTSYSIFCKAIFMKNHDTTFKKFTSYTNTMNNTLLKQCFLNEKKELQFSKVYWKETYEFWICSSKQIPSYQVKNDTVQVSFSHDIHLLAYWIEKKHLHM
jgi:hypothetical protein